MFCVRKIIRKTGNSENGFVLVFAIMAILIFVAIGFFALTTISGDVMITYRVVGERKALSAAEAGVHAVLASSSFVALPATNVDTVNDPGAQYTAAAPVIDPTTPKVHLPGYGPEYLSNNYYIDVTGTHSTYDSTVTIRVGTGDIPNVSETIQGKL